MFQEDDNHQIQMCRIWNSEILIILKKQLWSNVIIMTLFKEMRSKSATELRHPKVWIKAQGCSFYVVLYYELRSLDKLVDRTRTWKNHGGGGRGVRPQSDKNHFFKAVPNENVESHFGNPMPMSPVSDRWHWFDVVHQRPVVSFCCINKLA